MDLRVELEGRFGLEVHFYKVIKCQLSLSRDAGLPMENMGTKVLSAPQSSLGTTPVILENLYPEDSDSLGFFCLFL